MNEIVSKLSVWIEEKKSKGLCRTVVVYGDPASRECAKQFCGQLESKLETDCEVKWWKAGMLETSEQAREAAIRQATEADLIVIPVSLPGELPREITPWLDETLHSRRNSGGALVLLNCSLHHFDEPRWNVEDIVRAIANLTAQVGMEFCIFEYCESCQFLPESLDAFIRRTEETTLVLEEILEKAT